MTKNRCGFLSVAYFYNIQNINQLQDFEKEYGVNAVSLKTWRNTKKKRRLELAKTVYYINDGANGERDMYLQHFNLEQFKRLDRRERERHTFKSCGECKKNKHRNIYRLRRGNAIGPEPMEAMQAVMGTSPITPQQCREFADNFTKAANRVLQGAETPRSIEYYLQRKTKHPKDVAKTTKRKILRAERGEVEERLKKPEFVALYTSSQSEREYIKQRKTGYGQYRRNPSKPHTASIDSYEYKNELLTAKLVQVDDVNTMNYSKLAREVQLRRNDIFPKNAGQVVKEIARNMGFQVKTCQRKRISWMNYKKYRLNVQKLTSLSQLKQMKKQMISNGEIDVGEMIVPVDYFVMSINKEGNLEKTKHSVAGRKFNLRSIREDHLNRMDSLGVLRKLDVSQLTKEEVNDLLQKNGEVVMLDDSYNKERLRELIHTRHLLCWHDHSDILGKSHYLFVVWFLYDPLTYYRDEEYSQQKELKSSNVQNMVEQPYVYILAQSGTAVKDQLLYVPTRLEDIDDLEINLEIQNRTYIDKMRMFSGDTPARQLEAGQQCGGSYPCICGLRDQKFADVAIFNSPPKFSNLKDRVSLLSNTDTWHQSMTRGQLAPFDTMKAKELKEELQSRGIHYDSETAAELKAKLVKHLKGIKRPPALLCTGRDVSSIHDYEVSMVEPLHDIKNVINRVFDELPHSVKDGYLKGIIKEALELFRVQNREMKGSDCRLNLVKLTSHISSKQPVKESKKVLTLLTSLIELQRIAYMQEKHRTPRIILRAYNQSFVFAVCYLKLFNDPKSNTRRAMFGQPFHALSIHLAETMRLTNGRSIVAEQAERHFNTLRQISLRTSNRQNAHVITNALFRLSVQRKYNTDNQSYFDTQMSKVSRACRGLSLGLNTTLSGSFLKENQTATLNHFRRIADYLELGAGVWYKMDDAALIFLDGDNELSEHLEGPSLTHYRSTNAEDIEKRLEKSWKYCLLQKKHLGIPFLTAMTENEDKPQTSQASFPKRASLTESLRKENQDDDGSTSLFPVVVAAPCITEKYRATQQVKSNSVVEVIDKEVPSAAATTKIATSMNTEISTPESALTKDDLVKRAFKETFKHAKALDAYYSTRGQVKTNSAPILKAKYKAACKELRPMLLKCKQKIIEMEKSDITKKFKETHKISLHSKGTFEKQLSALENLIQKVDRVLGK